MSTMLPTRFIAAGLVGAGCVAVENWTRQTRATSGEKHKPLPGDALVANPMWQATRATSVHAPRAAVWPWLVQMGYPTHRAGWYTPYWMDRLIFGIRAHSADCIVPELQTLAAGERVPDSPDAVVSYFEVAEIETNQALVLISHTHPLPIYRDVNFSWAFILEDPRCGYAPHHAGSHQLYARWTRSGRPGTHRRRLRYRRHRASWSDACRYQDAGGVSDRRRSSPGFRILLTPTCAAHAGPPITETRFDGLWGIDPALEACLVCADCRTRGRRAVARRAAGETEVRPPKGAAAAMGVRRSRAWVRLSRGGPNPRRECPGFDGDRVCRSFSSSFVSVPCLLPYIGDDPGGAVLPGSVQGEECFWRGQRVRL